MFRKLTATAFLAASVVIPAHAEDAIKVDPSNAGPTKSISDQVPTMKGDGASTTPGKAMDSATPAMKPGNTAAVAPVTMSKDSVVLNDQDVKTWIGKPVYGNDQKKIGEVESFVRGPDNKVSELRAGLGGLLGFGETHVIATPAQFTLSGDRVILNVSSEQAKDLPQVTTTK